MSGFKEIIKYNIEALRKEKKMSKTDLAIKIGLTLKGLNDLQKPQNQSIIDYIDKIARALEVDVFELVLYGNKEYAKIEDIKEMLNKYKKT